ncbi:MAG: MCE family protein [Nitrospinae bacterium]|nr:MCE family protein [Nitrospinota bacterium]
MKNFSVEAKLGFFIIAAVTALFYLTFMIGGKKLFGYGAAGRTMVIYFDSIVGVSEKSDVRMAGVKVGEVAKIALEDYKAKVYVNLYGDYKIPEDSVATIQGKGLLGEKFIELRAGNSRKYLENGGKITRSIPPANIDDLVAKLSDSLDDIKKVTRSLGDSFGTEDGKEGLKSIIKNLSQFSEVVGGNKERLNAIIDNVEKATKVMQLMLAENRENLKGTMENFKAMSKSISEQAPELLANLDRAAAGIRAVVDENRANLREGTANIKEAAGNLNGVLTDNRENFKTAMDNLRKSSEKLDAVLASVRQITDKLEKGEGTVGKLIQDDEIYAGLNETLEGTKSLAKQAGVLKVSVGARDEFLGSSDHYTQGSRSYFSIGIRPREDKYYMLELSNDIRKPLVGGSRSTLSSLLYTFYIAKRYGNVTLRGGLMESSGGAAFDLHGWNDKLKLTVEAFNLGGYDQFSTQPQLKVTGTFYPQKYIYLYVGGDELLNQYYRTFFAGAGLMVDEDDFKFFMARFF